MDFTVGRWRARLVPLAAAESALDLRARLFRRGSSDLDRFDATARHLLIETSSGLVACARVSVQEGEEIASGYTGQHYDLAAFASRFPRALEVGRLCLDPACTDPDLRRFILAVLARVVTRENVAVLYGCSSFPRVGAGMARLAGHVAPASWAPPPRAGTVPLSPRPGPMPPLLGAYLALGAQVSDHAVVDPELDTLHVFTALPVASIRPERARRLIALLDAA